MTRKKIVLSFMALLASLLVIFFSLPAAAFTLRAGVAKAAITPDDPLGRITVMGNPIKGVIHDIYARVLSLYDGRQRLVIVTYDLNCLDVATPILRVRCRDQLGLDPSHLILLATHNHAAPIQIVPANFDYGRLLADQIFDLIQQAIANEQGPATLWFGAGHAPLVLSEYFDHRPDDELQVLKVMKQEETLAVLFNLATHPMQESFSRIEPGHPGYAVEELERRLPGTQAMYIDACGGDQFPTVGFMMLAPRGMIKLLAGMISDNVMRVLRRRMTEVTGPLSSRLNVIPLPLEGPMSYQDALALVAKKRIPTEIGFVPYPEPDRGTNWVRALLMHYEQGIPFPTTTLDRVCTDEGFLVQKLEVPRDYPCVYEEAIVAKLGAMPLVAMQGEVCSQIGTRIKDAFRGRGPLMVNAYMGEHNLYIPTRKMVEKNVYQSQVIQIQYASPVPWSPEVEDVMVGSMIDLIEAAFEQ